MLDNHSCKLKLSEAFGKFKNFSQMCVNSHYSNLSIWTYIKVLN